MSLRIVSVILSRYSNCLNTPPSEVFPPTITWKDNILKNITMIPLSTKKAYLYVLVHYVFQSQLNFNGVQTSFLCSKGISSDELIPERESLLESFKKCD